MSCLVNYIGLKSVGVLPVSGFYVNSLAGMSTELATDIADTEQVDETGVWEDIQIRSALKLKDDVLALVGNLEQIYYQTRKPSIHSLASVSSKPVYRGVVVEVPTSRYMTLDVKEIFVYSDAVVTTTVKIFDLNDGTTLLSKSVDLVVGLNTIPISFISPLKYFNQKIFIGVDASGFNTIEFHPEFYNFYSCDGQCSSWHNLLFESAESDLVEPKILNNIERFSYGQGVSINAEINTSVDEYICQNIKLFTQAWLNLLGTELLMEKLGSPRLNWFASSNLDQTDALRIEYDKRYLQALKNAVKGLPVDSICHSTCEGITYTGSIG